MSALKWWETAVIYQIYPRSFQDSNGDGIGDLPGITSRLDYIAGLGVDAVWISPFFASPQKDFGYDVSDYCQIDPDYGTMADFDALIARAHELGLRLMIDIVPAHCSRTIPLTDRMRPRACASAKFEFGMYMRSITASSDSDGSSTADGDAARSFA